MSFFNASGTSATSHTNTEIETLLFLWLVLFVEGCEIPLSATKIASKYCSGGRKTNVNKQQNKLQNHECDIVNYRSSFSKYLTVASVPSLQD